MGAISLAIRFRPTASPAKNDFVCRNVFAGPARTSRPGLWRRDSQAGSFTPKLKALEHLLGALIGSEASRSPGHGQAFGSIIMNWTSAKLRVKRQGNRRSIRPRKPSTRLSSAGPPCRFTPSAAGRDRHPCKHSLSWSACWSHVGDEPNRRLTGRPHSARSGQPASLMRPLASRTAPALDRAEAVLGCAARGRRHRLINGHGAHCSLSLD
jgi:hypothetical protein